MFLHNGVYFIQNADVGGVLCLDSELVTLLSI